MVPNSDTGGSGVVLPYPLAMVICDAIWKDPGNGKHTLLGTFSEIYAHSFPAVHSNMGIYVEVTGIRGKMPIMVRVIDAEESREEVFRLDGEAIVNDPIDVLQIAFNAAGVKFDAPGEYRVQFYANNQFILERRVLVKFTPQAAKQNG